LLGIVLAGGCLLSGPCGITTLQLQDFATSTIIRTTVTTFASVLESAIIAAGQEADAAANP
jgi:hypothetical protein